ncbi:MAG: glucose-6-phosphate dehydrogenase [Rhodospirillales bacterium RIFCSPLOWO2_12_FULL_58_28]|nr:MAG: glucose-6-phosphate dehydrogenase [Rhodospirillales bacterium RIFCSPLOWO2_02_FULL_58_16]OHC78714.1 MAG: glucose-6-phosphate dehydrogenase [Rhodospirillales bacterium RIFCSPLOWO2_12_FULL_58_28]
MATSQLLPVDTFDLVVFGGAGDLALRKLLPALYHRYRGQQIDGASRIIAVSRRNLTSEDFREQALAALKRFVGDNDRDEKSLACFLSQVFFIPVDAMSDSGWADLAQVLAAGENKVRAFYLAVTPDIYGQICRRIGAAGLVNERTRIVLEKPIGKDLATAHAINEAVGAFFKEHQIFRIDHYLGKETVQNLMALRFANALFEPLWNAAHIDHVQITVAELIGVEGRGDFYDTVGALRDILQNHLLQLLCLVAMEPPMLADANTVRDEKLKVLKALRPFNEARTGQFTVRGQYSTGASGGGAVPGYADEIKAQNSLTETFVAIRADIDNWRWAGTPFYLRTGKRMAAHLSEIIITFRPVPHSIFGETAGQALANKLVIRLQPNEGVKLWLMIKDPGPSTMRLKYVPLDMSFAQLFRVRCPDAYERLLMDVIRGDATLFMRRDEVEAAWDWIDPIFAAWAARSDAPKLYTAGTWGPSASIALIERDGRTWHEE